MGRLRHGVGGTQEITASGVGFIKWTRPLLVGRFADADGFLRDLVRDLFGYHPVWKVAREPFDFGGVRFNQQLFRG